MSKIEEFSELSDVVMTGGETLEETIEDCKELYAYYDKEINGNGSGYTLAQCNPANLCLLTMAHRFHHQMEYVDAWCRAELLPTSTGSALDALATLVGISRNPAGYATAIERFTISAVRTSATGIPEGTLVRTADGIYFKTTEYAEVAAGDLTVDVTMQATEAGTGSTDIPAGEINVLTDPIPYVKSAVNVSASTGGTDEEDDDSLTRRIYLAPSSFSVAGPEDAYEYYTESWRNDLYDKKIICEEGYYIYIYFLMGDEGRLPTSEEIADLEEYFEDVRKPMGDLVIGKAPEEVAYDIDLTYYIAESKRKSATTIQENVEDAVNEYIAWQRKIGRDIDGSELIKLVRTAGAKRPTITAPDDVAVTSIQVAALRNLNITYGGLEDD